MRTMSPSEMDAFAYCRQKWHFGYVKHIRFDTYSRARCLGSVVHAGLAGWYAKKSMEECYEAMRETADKYKMPEDDLAVGFGIFDHYTVFYADDLDKYEVMIIEVKQTNHGIGLKCIPDLVLREIATGKYFILDHKVIGNLAINKVFDSQKMVLYKVINEIVPVSGIIYNLIRSKLPIIPEPIKTGKRLKVFTPSSTTEAIFKKALRKAKLLQKDYPEEVKYFKTHKEDFFKRVPVEITAEEMEDFEERFDLFQEEIAGGVIYPARRWDCERQCDYYEMCFALRDLKGKQVLSKKGWGK